MMRSRSFVAIASTSVLALLVGCAAGSTDDADLAEADLATHPAEDDAGTGASLPMPSNGGSDDESTADAGTDAGDTSDAGGSSNSGGNNNGGNTGTTSCTAPDTCSASPSLGTVSGDTGAAVLTATGSTSKWFRVKVTEDDSGAAGVSMMTKVTLTSPPGANFDLYVYKGTSSTVECSSVKKSSTLTTGTDTVSLEWGETGLFSNGSSDDAFLTVEVRNASGTCSTNATWSLTVAGDMN